MKITTILKIAVPILIVAVVLSSALTIVPAGHRGVLLHFDQVDTSVAPMSEGIHLIMPIQDRIQPIEVRVKEFTQGASSASNDLQDVATQLTLNYHLDPEAVHTLYKNVGLSYENRVIMPAIQETVKAVTAVYDAEELITKRPIVKEAIQTDLTKRLQPFNIIVDVVSITDFKFSPEFTSAVEAKVTAQQQALKEENIIRVKQAQAEQAIAVAEGNKQAKILEAQGDAESIRLRTEALNEIYLEWYKTNIWNGQLPDVLVSDGSAFPFLNIPTERGNP